MSDDAPHDDESRLAYRLLQVGVLGPLVACGLAYLWHPPLSRTIDQGVGLLLRGDLPGLRAWGASLGAWAPLGTTLLMIVQALAAPIPAVLVTATNSWLFGWVAGGLLSIFSATLAAVVCYLLARACGEPLVSRMISADALARGDALIEQHGATAILVARLMPFVPFDPISYAAGLARMRMWPFVWTTVLGQIPAGMTYAYLAQQLDRPPGALLVIVPSALLGLAVLGWAMRRLLLSR